MTVQTILEKKASTVETVAPGVTLGEAIKMLAEKKIGALIVSDENNEIVGIFSERDVISALGVNPAEQVLSRPVREFMTDRVIVCERTSGVKAIIKSMLEQHIRHLPVVSKDNKLEGIVSIGDVLKQRIVELKLGEETRFQHWFEKQGVRTLK